MATPTIMWFSSAVAGQWVDTKGERGSFNWACSSIRGRSLSLSERLCHPPLPPSGQLGRSILTNTIIFSLYIFFFRAQEHINPICEKWTLNWLSQDTGVIILFFLSMNAPYCVCGAVRQRQIRAAWKNKKEKEKRKNPINKTVFITFKKLHFMVL